VFGVIPPGPGRVMRPLYAACHAGAKRSVSGLWHEPSVSNKRQYEKPRRFPARCPREQAMTWPWSQILLPQDGIWGVRLQPDGAA
jgi:hypothetical protein